MQMYLQKVKAKKRRNNIFGDILDATDEKKKDPDP